MMHSYAQTNIQLYNQLQSLGYTENDIASTFNAYELALELFPAHFRANGKHFLSHLVGTASILAAQQLRIDLVNAGLLHSAYLFGHFTDYRPGITDKKKHHVIEAVGEEVESLIFRYTLLPWNTISILQHENQIASLSNQERDILILKLANELEDNLDLGMAYGKKDHTATYIASMDALRNISEKLVSSSFSNELVSALQHTLSTTVSPRLQRKKTHYFSVMPKSFQQRAYIYLQKKKRKFKKYI